MDWLAVFLIVFLAIFTQSLTGFGLALVSMPLLTALLGVKSAAPVVAVFALVAELALVIYYRSALELGIVWRLAVASVFGIPLGVFALKHVDEQLVMRVLGVVVGGYALYALFNFRLPALQRRIWAYGAGFLAGVLGGAYNTSGPPVIIYGNCRRWPRDVFKSNLQGFFVLNSAIVLFSHLTAGNLTPLVWRYSLVALPAVALGMWTGVRMDRRLDPDTFRKIVLGLLLVLGLWLIAG